MNENIKKYIKIGLLLILLIVISVIIFINLEFKVDLKQTIFSQEDNINIEFKATFRGKDITDEVSLEKGTFDGTIGKYEVTFIYWKNNNKYTKKKKISIVDAVAPKIELIGGTKIKVFKGEEYKELGFSALDNYDGNLKDKVNISGEVDTTKTGIYKIVYTVKDSSGNESKSIREVEVILKSPLDMSVEEYTLSDYFSNCILKENNFDANYLNKILVIGDNSINYYNINNKVFLDFEELDQIDNYFKKLNFDKKIEKTKSEIILISFENISFENYDIKETINTLSMLINKLKTYKNNIIIQSFFPDLNYTKQNKINELNYYLANLCNEQKIKFLDTESILKNTNGLCDESICKNNEITQSADDKINSYLLNHQIDN